jgi:lipopolysaccharide transport system ATP-binding protein
LLSGWVKHALKSPAHNGNGKNEFWALKDVSFDLKQGESLALVGSNGAGKTTALKLLASITKPTSGSINIDGKLSALIELGAGFHPDLTGRENVYLNGTILGLTRKQIATRFDEIVEFSELERFIDTPVKRYSSGMVVRLGFAVASAIDPDILLVDEVLAVGDAAFQQKCMERIHSLIRNGTSIIFVSHNIYLIQAVCKIALYLDHGQVREHGNTKDIIDLYERDLHQRRALNFNQAASADAMSTDILEITRVEVTAMNADSNFFYNDQPVEIQIHYNAYHMIGKSQASIFIKRSDGLTCCMMRTKLDDFDLSLERGRGVISLYLESLQLVTGSYFVEAWFLNESDSMGIVSRAGRSDWFSVKGSALSYSDNSGVFEPNTRWSHHSEAYEPDANAAL